jgi:PAS domain S-box-containing protein
MQTEGLGREISFPMDKREGPLGLHCRDLSECGEQMQRQQDSEESARAILKACPLRAVLIDCHSVVLDLNESMVRSVGCPPEEIIGKRVFASGKPTRFEDQRNGYIFITHVHPLFDPEGRVERLVLFAEDVTEQHRNEEALIESEMKYRSLVDNLRVGIFRSTPESPGRILHVNAAMVKMFGFDSAEKMLQTAPLDCYLHPEDRTHLIEDLHREGFVRNREMLHRRRDGTPFWASFTAIAHLDAEGRMDWLEGIVEDVSQRKWTQEMLQESERRYRALFDQAPDSVVLIDTETGDFAEFNEQAHRALGYTREEFESLRIKDIEAQETPEEFAAHIEKLLRGGPDIFETRHRAKSGEIQDVRVSARAITLQGKTFVHSMWRDITEIKKTARALHGSEERHRATLAALPDLLFRISDDGVFLECHASDPSLLLIPQQEIPGKRLADTLAPELVEMTERLIRRTLETGELQTYEYALHLGRDHRRHVFEARMVPCGEHEVLVVDREITEKNKLLLALQQSEETAHTLLDSSPYIAALFDTHGVFLAVNEPALRSANRSADQVIGRHLSDLLQPEIAASRFERLRQVVELGEPLHFEDERDHRIFRTTFCPILNEEGEVFRVALFAEDVTKQRLNEQLAALGMTASNLAHSIKNIQSHLMGATDVIDEALTKGDLEKLRRAWPLLRRSSLRISSLVRDMLSIARGSEISLESVDLNQLIRDILASCAPHAEEAQVTLECDLDESLLATPLDFIRTHEAVLNLVGNAIEAIQWTRGRTGEVHVTTCTDAGSRAIEIRIADNGPGIPPEIRERIFDAFFTTKGSRGSGLGLAVVKKAIEEMGGTVQVESGPGAGSVFTIRLPMR